MISKNLLKVVFPVTEPNVRSIHTDNLSQIIPSLSIGERMALSGVVLGLSDEAYVKLCQLWQEEEPIPFSLENQVLYYTNPAPTPAGRVVGSCGPATASHFDGLTPQLMALGARCSIGKGERSSRVYDAMKEHQGVYLATVGGASVYLSSFITKVEEFAFPELGSACIKAITLKDFPLIVAADSTGRNLFDNGHFQYRRM